MKQRLKKTIFFNAAVLCAEASPSDCYTCNQLMFAGIEYHKEVTGKHLDYEETYAIPELLIYKNMFRTQDHTPILHIHRVEAAAAEAEMSPQDFRVMLLLFAGESLAS